MKATFELPEELIERLRARSEREARPVDAVAAEILQSGLEEEAPALDVYRSLGDLIVQLPTKRFDPEAFERLKEELHLDPKIVKLEEGLNWTREDRF
jgi:plasmid stability protein